MRRAKRLYEEFHPDNYSLNLSPDRDKMSFSGQVTITGHRVGKPSQRLTLHQKDLRITSAKIKRFDKKRGELSVELDRINTHGKFSEVRLHTKELLYPGNYEIKIEFSGNITDQMHGIYPCRFKQDGKDQMLIATQFESHHAREVFPCIDEPEAKATFDLTLITPTGETAIANTPVKTQEINDATVRTVFETSPKMSTYLLAFAYGPMAYVEGRSKSGLLVRSYATPANAKLLDYSLRAAIRSVEFFEDYFGVPYPLAKLDLLALPDFSSAAMENWGLITFRESVMLVDPTHTGIETKQQVVLVITHEVAHQWFGNLVTMRWWDDLWLNESFANLMEYRAADAIHPEWKIWQQFINTEMNMAPRRDSLPNVQPVRTKVNQPDELGALFDPAIVYAKGGNILNMLRNFIGEPAFRTGLKLYFQKHAYGSTTVDDLWAALSESSQLNVAQIMDPWLNRPGYPVVEVDWTPGTDHFSATQHRLVIGPDTHSDTIWNIPLAPSLATATADLSLQQNDFEIIAKDKSAPLVLNQDGRSYFVPLYTNPKHHELIIEDLASGHLSPIDRLLLLLQGSLLEQACLTLQVDNLQLVAAMGKESEEAVWVAIAGILAGARRLFADDEPTNQDLNKFIRELVKPAVLAVSWQSLPADSAQTLRLRDLLLGMAASSEDPATLKTGAEYFRQLKTPADLPPDIRGSVYYIGARYGSSADFDKLLKLYLAVEGADEKEEIAAALTTTKDTAQLKNLLAMISSSDIRLQDAPFWFAYLIRNPAGKDLAWTWLQRNWGWVEANYSSDKSYDRFARYSAMVFSTLAELKSYKKFFGQFESDPGLARPIQLGIEEIEGRIAWRTKNESDVRAWLTNRC